QPETVPVESSAPHGSGGKDSYPDQSKGDRFKGVDEDDGILAASGEQEGEKKQKKEDEEEKEEEEEDEEQERAARPRQQIFRLHQDVWSKAHRQSMDVCRINSMFNERQPALIASVPSTIDGMCSSARQTSNSLLQENKTTGASLHAVTPSCDLHLYEDVGVQCPLMVPEPIYAVVDVRAKRSRRLARTLNTATPDGSVERADGGNRKVSVSLPQISDGVELVTVTERRPVTARSCSNYDDYEDVNYLFVGHLRSTGGTETDSVGTDGSREQLPTRHESYGEEHIYEPILVAERIPSVTTGSSSSLPAPATDHQHSHSLWRHLKRMHLQGSWRRLTHRNTGCPKPEEPHTRSTTATALEGLGRRLDSHRRSIKKRIKNLCERIDPVTSTSANGASGGTTTQLLEEGCDDHPKAEPVPETSTGVASRKSVSLDSFLLAKGQQSSVPRC
uniref:Uncharacterized protein n=1 Tax=Anopheles christyi TaxID=43041 RepID=A0A182KFF8_9DIPT